MPLPRCIGFAVELIKGLAGPEAVAGDSKPLAVTVDRHGVGGVGLEFDRVRASSLGRPDDLNGPVKTLIVVRGYFGDDVTRIALADAPLCDPDPRCCHLPNDSAIAPATRCAPPPS